MKRETISLALNRLDERHISDTVVFSPGAMQDSTERIVFMKKKRMITFALAAALMLALGITAYAIAGIPRWTATHAMSNTGEYSSLDDLRKVEKITGYDVCLVDRFSNEYAFTGMRVDGEAVYDKDYNVLEEYYSVRANYTKANHADLLLSLSPVLDLPGSQEPPAPSSSSVIGGTEVRLYRDHYKFVPEDYEKTDDDLAAEAAGHFYISFGADRIEEKDILSADFVMNNVEYNIFCNDASECSDEMLIQMVSELLASAKA